MDGGSGRPGAVAILAMSKEEPWLWVWGYRKVTGRKQEECDQSMFN